MDGGGRGHDGAVQQCGQARHVEGGRGGQQPEVLAEQVPGLQGEPERQVGVELPFVDLVEQDGGDTGQFGVVQHAPQQQSRGDDLDAGVRGDLALTADGVAHGGPDRLAEQRGHPGRGRAGGDPAGFGDDDLPGACVGQREGHQRRLARAGRGLQDGGPPGAQRVDQFGQDRRDGQGREQVVGIDGTRGGTRSSCPP